MPAQRSRALVPLVALLASACVSYKPLNVPIEHVDPAHGYRPGARTGYRGLGNVWLFLAFSGGGTRAAALAYGVLEELRDTEIVIDGRRKRLLDEVDGVSGVSGGSFTAAYYGLFGDRIFEDFEQRFLDRNVQRALVLQALLPWNLVGLMTPALSRSELASRYYARNVFDHATFAELDAASGPNVYVNATDLVEGNRVTFTQDAFDVICSNLDAFPVSSAVAASSAVPGLLSPLTLRNYAGRCDFQPPAWFLEALRTRRSDPRRYQAAVMALPYLDPERKRFIHLVDGGISDNLGMRQPLERIAAMGGIARAAEISGLENLPKHLLVIVVNAETEPDPAIDLTAAAPGLAASMSLVSGAQIRRYNFETLQLSHAAVREWSRALSQAGHPVTGHLAEVGFDLLEDGAERQYLKRLPTSFHLSKEQVDRLRASARLLLRESPEFQAALEAMREGPRR